MLTTIHSMTFSTARMSRERSAPWATTASVSLACAAKPASNSTPWPPANWSPRGLDLEGNFPALLELWLPDLGALLPGLLDLAGLAQPNRADDESRPHAARPPAASGRTAHHHAG